MPSRKEIGLCLLSFWVAATAIHSVGSSAAYTPFQRQTRSPRATGMTAALQAPGELGWVVCGLTTPHTPADRIPGRRSQPVLHGPARCRMGSRRRQWLAALSLALVQSAVTPDTRPAVLVTGANRGIGLEIARGFGALGHRVVLAFSTGQSCSVQLNLATKRTWSERLS